MKIKIVIPARLASTRLPEKLLRKAAGKTVLQHTYDSVAGANVVSRAEHGAEVVVAVDDPRLLAEVTGFGGQARMTSPTCNSGTDRVAEIASQESEVDVFINVQGDEPEMDPAAIDLVAQALAEDKDADMATIVTPIKDARLLHDPACVKAVIDDRGRAVYFSRAAIPHHREGDVRTLLQQDPPVCFQHLGLYAYRRAFLDWFTRQPPSSWEQAECLEQLRAVQAGKRIAVRTVPQATPGIDTLEDFEAFVGRLQQSS
ncbi:MAG: 3-deoxy-manno-octulosonate cytidylyltransferase [Planctomycetota bacterium]